MKKEEEQVRKYLESEGFTDIVYEPDGNIPPDFLVDNTIAIEVRRLNQYVDIGGSLEPIEKADYTVWTVIKSIAENIQSSDYEHSIFLFPEFKRPLNIKDYKQQIIDQLNDHLKTPKEKKRYFFSENLSISTFPASGKLETVYRMGGSSDNDSGGFIVSEIYKNLPHILSEKENKVAPYKNKYNTWWLALVDTIGYGLDAHDFSQFQQLPSLKTDFDKVLLLSPLDHTKAVFLID